MTKDSVYHGRVLRVNLSTGTITKEEIDPQDLRKWVGGNGIALKILYDEVPPEVEPFDPDNRFILAAGPLNGTRAPGSGTWSVVTKGPLTGLLVSAQANGFFGARMRFAGYEFIVVEGASPEWKYLYIHDGEAELRPADHLLGLDTWETEEHIKEEVGQKKASVVCIGPGGENLVPFGVVCGDHGHVASTNGPGAVMGSKKLKAVVAYGSDQSVPVVDADRVKEVRKAFLEAADASYMGQMVRHMGTHGYFTMMNQLGGITMKNYTTNVEPTINRWFGAEIRERYQRKPEPCWACPYAHCSTMTVDNETELKYVGEEPEYEQLTGWTLNIGNHDFGWGIKLSNINDGMGLCAKECSYAVSLAMELYEKEEIGPEQTGGLELRWGNVEAVAQLIEDIAHRRGFGAVLAQGVKRAAEQLGGAAQDAAVYMGRGLAPQVVDGRFFWPLWYGMNFSDTGSFYGSGGQDPDIGFPDQIPLHDVEQNPPSHAKAADRWVMYDALGTCMFFTMGRLQPVVDMLNAATGWDMTLAEFLEVGARITAISRAFNIRNGLTPEMEKTVSPRYAMKPVDGPGAMLPVGPTAVIEQWARGYYRGHGWDEETSKPLPETLHQLGLDYVAKDLWE